MKITVWELPFDQVKPFKAFPYWGRMGECPPPPAENLLIPPTYKNSAPVDSPPQSLLLFHFCFNFILFGHLGHVNFDFNWCSVFTESWFQLWKTFGSSKSLLLRFPSPCKKIAPSKISSEVGEPNPSPTPYRYLDNPAISDNGKLSGDAFADPIIPF